MRRYSAALVCLLPLAGVSAAHAQCDPPSFTPPVSYAVGSSPYGIAVADLNGDGVADMVSANSGSFDVSVLLGYGDGSFAPGVSYAAGNTPVWVEIGDLNGDNAPDLAVANFGGSVSVLLGNGDGTFGPADTDGLSSGPTCIAIGFLNDDSAPDLVTANYNGNSASVLLGNGDGTFQPATDFAAGANPFTVVIGDLSGDGHADVAVSGPSVSVLLGNGDGSLQGPVSYPVGGWGLALGDLSGDGAPDLVTQHGSASGGVAVLLGYGDGTFAPYVTYPTFDPYSLKQFCLADVNGDGQLDVAATETATDNGGLTVLLGDGDGTLDPYVRFPLSGNAWPITSGDLDGDGRDDLIASDSAGVDVLINTTPSVAINEQPVNQTVNPGGSAMMSVTADGAVAYRWRRNGVPLTDGGPYAGVTTDTLSIAGITENEAGVYDVRVTAACNAAVLSRPAALCVGGSPACPADFNGDGILNSQDFIAFLNAFMAGC